MRLSSWPDAPRALRAGILALSGVFLYGGVVHVVQWVAGGWLPYAWAPLWLAVYFTSLTVLDPLAAVLLLTRRIAGTYLAPAVFVSDALANGYATYVLRDGAVTERIAQAVISGLALVSLVVCRYARTQLRLPDDSR